MLYFNQEAVARRGAFRQLSPCAGNVALRRYWTSGIGALPEMRRAGDLRIDPIMSVLAYASADDQRTKRIRH
jgi:hypothetical protein